MDNDLDIDFRFDGPTASFEIGNSVGTGVGTDTYSIFVVLITKASIIS
jgi:hypothetical protein